MVHRDVMMLWFPGDVKLRGDGQLTPFRPPFGVGGADTKMAVHLQRTIVAQTKKPTASAQQSLSIDTLIRLTELVLTLNKFSFNSFHFLQTKGVAMGTRMGSCYACLF
eukprot:g45493.t1